MNKHSGIIYAISQVAAKVLILFFIYLFTRAVGRAGLELYSFAYFPLALFIDLSAIGLIPGTSKLVSESNDDGKSLFKSGTLWMLILGIIFFLIFELLIGLIVEASILKYYEASKVRLVTISLRISDRKS